jgi:hypothetical protein
MTSLLHFPKKLFSNDFRAKGMGLGLSKIGRQCERSPSLPSSPVRHIMVNRL